MRFLAALIMRGRMQAAIFAVVTSLCSLILPPVSILSSAAVALVTLRKGIYEGMAVVLIAVTAGTLLEWGLLGSLYLSLSYGLFVWLPSGLIAILLRETSRLSLALEALCFLAGLAVVGLYTIYSDPSEIWSASLLRVKPMLENALPGLDANEITRRLEAFSHHATGIAAAGSLTSLSLGLLLARGWQAMLFNPGGFRAEFVDLRAHAATAYVSLALMIVAFALDGRSAEIAKNLIMLLLVLYLIVGLAVFHAVLSSAKAPKYGLVGFYVALFLLPQISLLVALTGLTDTWLNWRRRFTPGLK